MGDFFHQQRSHNRNSKGQKIFASWLLLLKQIFYSSECQTRCAPHIRAKVSVHGLLNKLVIASIPCWLIGLWNLGYQINQSMAELGLNVLPGWQGGFLSALGVGHDPVNVFTNFLLGLLYFLPIFFICFQKLPECLGKRMTQNITGIFQKR